jgi:hypothetical protein
MSCQHYSDMSCQQCSNMVQVSASTHVVGSGFCNTHYTKAMLCRLMHAAACTTHKPLQATHVHHSEAYNPAHRVPTSAAWPHLGQMLYWQMIPVYYLPGIRTLLESGCTRASTAAGCLTAWEPHTQPLQYQTYHNHALHT